VRLRGFLNSGAASAALHPALAVEPGDILLEKPRFGAFHGTDLELILRARGIDTVIIAGIDTRICCDTTAREANARDFRVLFLSDGTATASDEAQEATLKTIGAVFGQVLTVEDVLQKIRSSPAVAATA
jgi:ureidoacrylate peracid hydrolase